MLAFEDIRTDNERTTAGFSKNCIRDLSVQVLCQSLIDNARGPSSSAVTKQVRTCCVPTSGLQPQILLFSLEIFLVAQDGESEMNI